MQTHVAGRRPTRRPAAHRPNAAEPVSQSCHATAHWVVRRILGHTRGADKIRTRRIKVIVLAGYGLPCRTPPTRRATAANRQLRIPCSPRSDRFRTVSAPPRPDRRILQIGTVVRDQVEHFFEKVLPLRPTPADIWQDEPWCPPASLIRTLLRQPLSSKEFAMNKALVDAWRSQLLDDHVFSMENRRLDHISRRPATSARSGLGPPRRPENMAFFIVRLGWIQCNTPPAPYRPSGTHQFPRSSPEQLPPDCVHPKH